MQDGSSRNMTPCMIKLSARKLQRILASLWMLGQSGCYMKKQNPPNLPPDSVAPACAPSCPSPVAGSRSAGDRVLPVPPRREGPRVAFAGSRLGWLTRDALVVFSPGAAEQAAPLPLGTARGVTALGSALLAIGQDGVETVYRVPAQGAVQRWPAVLPITPYGIVRLFAEAATASGLWVVGDTALCPVQLRLRGVSIEVNEPLPLGAGATQREQLEVARLPSGAFLLARGATLSWLRPGDPGTAVRRSAELPVQFGEIQGLAAAPAGPPPAKEDRVWMSLQHGGLAHFALDVSSPAALTPRLLSSVPPKAPEQRVHTLAAADHVVAAVMIQQEQPQPAWTVVVFAEDGQERFRAALPWQPVMSEAPDVSVALPPSGDRLAVASADRIVVWDLQTRRVVEERAQPR